MSLDMDVIEEGLNLLSQGRNLPLMPNLELPTLGGHVFWNNLAEVKGWRLQQNIFTGHCRVLDPDDVRRAWGGEEAIMNFFRDIVK